MRFLVKTKVIWDGNNTWTFNSSKGTRVFKGTDEQFAKFLMRIKAKDNLQDPRSLRSLTYKDMVDEIKKGVDNIIYIWSNKYPDKNKPVKFYYGEKTFHIS